MRRPNRSEILTLVGVILTGLGIVLLNLNGETKSQPQLTVSSESSVVFDPQFTEKLEIRVDEGDILWEGDSDLTHNVIWSRELAVSNVGDDPIEGLTVRQGFRLIIGSSDQPLTALWDLQMLKWSREEIGFDVLTESLQAEDGIIEVPIDFLFLEKDDGAHLRVVFSGPRDIPLLLKGTRKGDRTKEFPPKVITERWIIAVYAALAIGGILVIITVIGILAQRGSVQVPSLIQPITQLNLWLPVPALPLLLNALVLLFFGDYTHLADLPNYTYLLDGS